MNGCPVDRPGFDLAAWVAASCARHGVPVKVTDAGVISDVVVLVGSGGGRPQAERGARPAPSEPPDDVDSVRVELSGPTLAGGDVGVVDDRRDDGGSDSQTEVVPGAA